MAGGALSWGTAVEKDPSSKPLVSFASDDDEFSHAYLKEYWPESPGKAAAWADNAVLMLAYQEAALAVREHFSGREYFDAGCLDGAGPGTAFALC